MLYISKDGTIRLTRGDTACLTVSIENDINEEPYELTDQDTIRFTVRKRSTDPTILIQKIVVGSYDIKLDPSDTKCLEFKTYIYDVELTTERGDVYTIVEPHDFEIMKEVTY